MNPKTGFVTLFTVCAFLNPTVEGTNNQSPFAPECQAWKNVTDLVTRLEQLNVTCAVNPPCTGFECNGNFELAGNKEMFRFGMSFLPCTDPLRFEVVADVPDYPFNFTLEVGKNQMIKRSIPVPGGTRSLQGFTAETNLTILLISVVSKDGLQLITIETNITIKIMPVSMIKDVVMIPRVTLPFPYCSSPPSVYSEPQTTSQAPDFEWTGAHCVQLSMEKGCEGQKQTCTSSGRCACFPGLFWHADIQQCNNITKNSTPFKSDVWIIVAATVSAVVIVVGILIVIVFKYRRYRERYGQHTLLVDRENDTELDDPDPPMLHA